MQLLCCDTYSIEVMCYEQMLSSDQENTKSQCDIRISVLNMSFKLFKEEQKLGGV